MHTNMENEARNKIHQVAWKFRTQNLVTYTLILRKNLEYFLKSILFMLYIVLKLGKSEGNALNGVQIGVEMKKL